MPARATRSPLLALVLGVTTGVALCVPSAALAVEPETAACDAPVESTTQTGLRVADPDCEFRAADGTIGAPFVALPGARVHTGIEEGQAFRIEVPQDWNGDLVVYAHGYRGTGTTVHVDSPALRQHLVDRGYAWAASSFQTNGYDPERGVEDSHDLIERFRRLVPGSAALDEVLVHGISMGGHVAVEAAERYPGTWSAAYPVCGALWDVEQLDWLLDASVLAAAVTDTDIPATVTPTEWAQLVSQEILPGLFTQRPALTPAGEQWAAALQQRSGGTRPGSASSAAFWSSVPAPAPFQDLPFLLAFYPGLVASPLGVVADNAQRVYQLDDDPAVSAQEEALNARVARFTRSGPLPPVPPVDATATAPVLSLHTIGDLFVPLAAEQVYASEAAQASDGFVSRAIRANGHCEFTVGELAKGFDDLVRWTVTGRAPAGDPVLDPEAVARPAFGCRFTETSRPTFAAEACPTFSDVEGSVHGRAIRAQLAAGVVQGFGDGRFRPDASITRGQVASVVTRALGLEPVADGPTFTDTSGTTHDAAIRALAAAGLVTGFPDGTFRPDLAVTRGQVASVLARALGQEDPAGGCFPDVAGVHAPAVCALADLGIATGFPDGTFRPGLPVSRGQATSMVDRAFG